MATSRDDDISSFGTIEDESYLPAKKKAKKRSPSAITWGDIQLNFGIVQPFIAFVRRVRQTVAAQPQDTFTDSCDDSNLSHFSFCLRCFNATIERDNEEFAILCFSLFISHLAAHFEDYFVKVFPVVKANPSDRRSEKRSDYSLIKLNNERTVLICEIKFGISQEVAELSQEFAQLFLEVFYAIGTDKDENHYYKHLIGILADHLTWHIMVLDISSKPYGIISYVCAANETLTIGKICVYLRTLFTNLQ